MSTENGSDHNKVVSFVEEEYRSIDSEEKWRSITRSAPDTVFLVNRLGNIIYINRVPGGDIPVEAVIGTKACDYVSPEDRGLVEESIRRVFETGQQGFYEISARGAGGRMTWYSTRLGPVEYNGRIEAVVLITRDISEEKQTAARWESLVQSASDIILTLDRDFRITFINHTDGDVSPQDSIGRCVLDFVPDDHREKVRKVVESVFQTGEAASYETMVEVAPNRVLWYSTRVSAVRSVNERQAGGEIIESVILITTDITSQKQNEEARERLHTRLVKSQKMEALGRLSAGIAHKFNNTMAGISALAENCQVELEEAGAGREFGTGAFGILEGLEKIQRQITISKETVSQLLLFSQGASDDTKKERNLVEELKESASMVRALLPPHIKVAEHFNVGQVRLKVNHMQIQQMILLLAMNARDAIQGHGTLNLGLELMDMESITCQSCGEEARGPFAEICVCDSGLGMGEETLARIFEPFFSTREPGQGTGLGMSIVHGIVHDHGGHITVKSTPGQGTTVKIYLPCEASGKAEQSKGQTMPCGVSSSHRIMFVDDDELITEQMDKYLTHRGYRVTALSDPLEALNMMQQPGERFSLLITDHFMPEMTGMELVAKLRKGGLRLPVIICTGNPVDITDDWREAGISELFIKPFRFSRLVEVIEQHLADSESGCC